MKYVGQFEELLKKLYQLFTISVGIAHISMLLTQHTNMIFWIHREINLGDQCVTEMTYSMWWQWSNAVCNYLSTEDLIISR